MNFWPKNADFAPREALNNVSEQYEAISLDNVKDFLNTNAMLGLKSNVWLL